MTTDEMREIISQCKFADYEFAVYEKNGVPYLQGRYLEADIVTGDVTDQHTRKWMLSEHMVTSELVQTALKCALTSAEHRVREHFLYRGERVFGPHFDIEALYELARTRRLDYRGKKRSRQEKRQS